MPADGNFAVHLNGPLVLRLYLFEGMLHPVVRMDEDEVAGLLKSFNEALARDGYELYPAEWISGHAVYSWWRLRDSFHGATPGAQIAPTRSLDRSRGPRRTFGSYP